MNASLGRYELKRRKSARVVQVSAAPSTNRLTGGTRAVIAYAQGAASFVGSMIATQATIASQPTERMIQVQTAACAIVRMLILAVLRILLFTLIPSSNRDKQEGLWSVVFVCCVANLHHWGGGTRLGAGWPGSRVDSWHACPDIAKNELFREIVNRLPKAQYAPPEATSRLEQWSSQAAAVLAITFRKENRPYANGMIKQPTSFGPRRKDDDESHSVEIERLDGRAQDVVHVHSDADAWDWIINRQSKSTHWLTR